MVNILDRGLTFSKRFTFATYIYDVKQIKKLRYLCPIGLFNHRRYPRMADLAYLQTLVVVHRQNFPRFYFLSHLPD